jgi:hypothetical protein
MIKIITTFLSLGFIGACTGPAYAAAIAGYEFDSLPITSDTRLTLGFLFQTTQAVAVTDLGYFDFEGDGFATSHEVGIFGVDGLLTSTTVGAGIADPLLGHFRYHSIAPVQLSADTLYLLAATTGGPADNWGYGPANLIAGLQVSPFIVIPSDGSAFVYQADDTLQFPTEHFGYQLYAGPNMLLADAQAVPEPASFALMGMGGIMLVFLALRRARLLVATITPIAPEFVRSGSSR